jgi:hypothetical protein
MKFRRNMIAKNDLGVSVRHASPAFKCQPNHLHAAAAAMSGILRFCALCAQRSRQILEETRVVSLGANRRTDFSTYQPPGFAPNR